MKSKLLNISILIGLIMVFFSCEKDEDRVVIKSDITPNTFTALSSDSFVLVMDEAANVFQSFAWTDVDFGFDVAKTFKIQIDSTGKNFANAVDVSTVNNLYASSINIGDFNKVLLDMGIEPDAPVELDFRVVTIINDNVDPVYSNVVSAVVTPYATVFPPIYMCGAATGGWDWTKDVELRSFAPSKYYTIAYFINNETFRFFKQRDWGPTSYNYPYFDGGIVTDSMENASDGDQNFKILSPTGYYAITVDLKNKTVDFDAVDEPDMYMTGAALGGWDWSDNFVKMTWKKHGVYEAETEFINGEAFRFFDQADWGPTSYNYPYFPAGSVDELFENANDGDKNFKFVGTTGMYKITVNFLDLTVTLEEAAGK
ncbi:MAG: SusE domain-containing protein [Bacteroidales bacterium]|nr:SusE domain-containing protein [Bacteroidales bacterium]